MPKRSYQAPRAIGISGSSVNGQDEDPLSCVDGTSPGGKKLCQYGTGPTNLGNTCATGPMPGMYNEPFCVPGPTPTWCLSGGAAPNHVPDVCTTGSYPT